MVRQHIECDNSRMIGAKLKDHYRESVPASLDRLHQKARELQPVLETAIANADLRLRLEAFPHETTSQTKTMATQWLSHLKQHGILAADKLEKEEDALREALAELFESYKNRLNSDKDSYKQTAITLLQDNGWAIRKHEVESTDLVAFKQERAHFQEKMEELAVEWQHYYEGLKEELGPNHEQVIAVDIFIDDLMQYRNGAISKPSLLTDYTELPERTEKMDSDEKKLEEDFAKVTKPADPAETVPDIPQDPRTERLFSTGTKTLSSALRKLKKELTESREHSRGELAALDLKTEILEANRGELSDLARATYKPARPEDADRMRDKLLEAMSEYMDKKHLDTGIPLYFLEKDEIIPGGYHNRALKIGVDGIIAEVKLTEACQLEEKQLSDKIYRILRDMVQRYKGKVVAYHFKDLNTEADQTRLALSITSVMQEIGKKHPLTQYLMNMLPEYQDAPLDFAKDITRSKQLVDQQFQLDTVEGFRKAADFLEQLHLAIHISPNISNVELMKRQDPHFKGYAEEFNVEAYLSLDSIAKKKDFLSRHFDEALIEQFQYLKGADFVREQNNKYNLAKLKAVLSPAFQTKERDEQLTALAGLKPERVQSLYQSAKGQQFIAGLFDKLELANREWREHYMKKVLEYERDKMDPGEKLIPEVWRRLIVSAHREAELSNQLNSEHERGGRNRP